jgi:hypothetical protein
MPTTYKTLGQVQSTGTIGTYDRLYTVPASTSSVVSSIVICNQTASAQYFRLACASSSATVTAKEFISFGTLVPANDTIPLVIGVTLDSTIRHLMCSSTSASVSFSAFGAETS